MNVKARGFALIEIVIGVAISSIIGLTLYAILNQIYRSESYVGGVIAVGMRVALVQERLQRDLTGMFLIPEIKKAVPEPVSAAKPGSKIAQVEQFLQARRSEPKTELEEEPVPPIAQQLLSSSQDDGQGQLIFKELTFLTDNPLQVYGENKPRIVRVIYTLEPTAGQSNSWSLFRQESNNLNYQEMRNDSGAANNYLLISGIKSLNFSYHLAPAEGEPQQVANLEQEEPKELPKYIEVDLELWEDDLQKEFQKFKFWYMPVRLVQDAKKPKADEVAGEAGKEVAKPVKNGGANAKI